MNKPKSSTSNETKIPPNSRNKRVYFGENKNQDFEFFLDFNGVEVKFLYTRLIHIFVINNLELRD